MSDVDVDADIYAALDSGRVDDAFGLAIARYGAEVGGYLSARFGQTDGAGDAFSLFCEDVWRGLPGFRRASSLRTWLYVVARHAALRDVRASQQRRAREVPLSQAPAVDALVFELRAATTRWQRTDVKDRIAALRAALSPDDRELLILRVDRQLSWRAIAAIVDADHADDERAQAKTAAALRKRFERVKERLAKDAQAAGLLPEPS